MSNSIDAEAMMAVAVGQAEKSWAEGGIPIGAALFDARGALVSRGHNERVQRGDPTAHAEIVAIRNAGRRRDWSTLTLATTLSPCPMCSGAIALYRIPLVLIGESDSYRGPEAWLREYGVELRTLMDTTCTQLMARLKEERPDLWAEDIGE